MTDTTIDWTEDRIGFSRRLTCVRTSGYEARIVVDGDQLSALLWKRSERAAFTVPALTCTPAEVDPLVERVKEQIAACLEELESGHS